jgi:hypothetical protein
MFPVKQKWSKFIISQMYLSKFETEKNITKL